MQTPEQKLDKQIMLFCGQHNWLCFHCNVGHVLLKDGRYFSTGLPNGFPDLLILTDNGVAIFCETKIKPRKPTQQQLDFIQNLSGRRFLAFVCYSFDEFLHTLSVNNLIKHSENITKTY